MPKTRQKRIRQCRSKTEDLLVPAKPDLQVARPTSPNEHIYTKLSIASLSLCHPVQRRMDELRCILLRFPSSQQQQCVRAAGQYSKKQVQKEIEVEDANTSEAELDLESERFEGFEIDKNMLTTTNSCNRQNLFRK